jgi:alanyl-tRNA synthetase
MTPRLYQHDSLRLDFRAEVVAHAKVGGRDGFLLSETAFYPESGGQLADLGWATWNDGGEVTIVDAQEVGSDVVHLVGEGGDLPSVGIEVAVRIDEARRRHHMSQHTGQHMLSRALLDLAGAETISSRLGRESCTIDTPLEAIDSAVIAQVEQRVNQVILEDRPVRVHWPTPEALAQMPLRRTPKVSDGIRVIEVEGFDVSPCGGTHVLRPGQVGMVHMTGIERYKGGLRVTFLTGLRALEDYQAKEAALAQLTTDFSCGVDGVASGVARLREDLRTARQAVTSLQQRLARLEAERLLATAQPLVAGGCVVHAVLSGDGPEGTVDVAVMRALGEALTAQPDVLVLLAGPIAGGVHLLVQRGAESVVDCATQLRAIAQACGGRGGGRPERAEGRMPEDADMVSILADQVALMVQPS